MGAGAGRAGACGTAIQLLPLHVLPGRVGTQPPALLPAAPRPRSKAVRPGGLLVLELPHPSDLWGGYCLEDEQVQWGGGSCCAVHRTLLLHGCSASGSVQSSPAGADLSHSRRLHLRRSLLRRGTPRAPTAARRCLWSGAETATTLTCGSRRAADWMAGWLCVAREGGREGGSVCAQLHQASLPWRSPHALFMLPALPRHSLRLPPGAAPHRGPVAVRGG